MRLLIVFKCNEISIVVKQKLKFKNKTQICNAIACKILNNHAATVILIFRAFTVSGAKKHAFTFEIHRQSTGDAGTGNVQDKIDLNVLTFMKRQASTVHGTKRCVISAGDIVQRADLGVTKWEENATRKGAETGNYFEGAAETPTSVHLQETRNKSKLTDGCLPHVTTQLGLIAGH